MNLRVLALLMRPAAGQQAVLALPIVAFGVVTSLLLVVVGGAQSFWRWTDPEAPIYQALAAIAVVLLVVPLMSLSAAAARLSARRRDERLSTLRLLGVGPLGVGIATVVESGLLAAMGAAAGLIGYLVVSPLIALVPFRGRPLGMDGVILPPAGILAVMTAVLVLATASAMVSLRQVAISPLGVRMRSTPGNAHWLRAVIGGVVIAALFGLIAVFPSVAAPAMVITVLALLFAIAVAVLDVIGPWVLKMTASRQLRRAESPERLLAARSVLDSPKAAWRQVSGIAMTSFMAVFAGTGVSLMEMLSAGDVSPTDVALITDIRTGLIITLVASFVMVAASVGVNQASSILDQRDLHRSLHRLGVEIGTVDRARRRAIMSPLLITALGSAACAAVLVFPLLGIAVITAPVSVMTIALVVSAGIAVVWVSTRVTSPLLARSFREE